MSTVTTLVEAHPSAFEVAILHLTGGATARVHHPFGVREYRPLLVEDDVYAVVPGYADVIGWGAVPCWYYSLRGIRNGRHRLDRPAWHDAAESRARARAARQPAPPRARAGPARHPGTS